MSRWSGKCDFFDALEMRGVLNSREEFEDFKKKYKIYLSCYPTEDELLSFDTPEDMIPYYTHIVISAYHNKEHGGHITLSDKSWLEIEEEKYYPSRYRIRIMKEFDKFVREHGKEPLWEIHLEEREKWTPCPLGEPYFCEPKLKNGRGSKTETKFCPYLYANRKMPCMLQKSRERKEERKIKNGNS